MSRKNSKPSHRSSGQHSGLWSSITLGTRYHHNYLKCDPVFRQLCLGNSQCLRIRCVPQLVSCRPQEARKKDLKWDEKGLRNLQKKKAHNKTSQISLSLFTRCLQNTSIQAFIKDLNFNIKISRKYCEFDTIYLIVPNAPAIPWLRLSFPSGPKWLDCSSEYGMKASLPNVWFLN